VYCDPCESTIHALALAGVDTGSHISIGGVANGAAHYAAILHAQGRAVIRYLIVAQGEPGALSGLSRIKKRGGPPWTRTTYLRFRASGQAALAAVDEVHNQYQHGNAQEVKPAFLRPRRLSYEKDSDTLDHRPSR
jgi:hypothetical protein